LHHCPERGFQPGGEIACGAFGRLGVANDASLADRVAAELELRLEERDKRSGAAPGSAVSARKLVRSMTCTRASVARRGSS
jgi:hypothetical protein